MSEPNRTQPTAQERAKILEALASYQKRGAVLTNGADLAQMLRPESDRGVVIILASFVEDALLERVLATFGPLTTAQRKNLTRPGSPLNSAAAVAHLASAMKLIKDHQFHMLETLRHMRNACAHSRLPINFGTEELREALKLLVALYRVADSIDKLDPTAFRYIFILAAGMLLGDITEDGPEENADAPVWLAIDAIQALHGSSPPSPGKRTTQRGKRPRSPPSG
jgi:hypothetical protein